MAGLSEAEAERLAAAWRAGEHVYRAQSSPLYSFLSKTGADDPEIYEMTAPALGAAPPVHLFTSAHYMLLGGIEDPLARFFPTLTENPAPPEEAWPDFRRFCLAHRDELTRLMSTKPIQMTYVERCRVLMPAMCLAGQMAGGSMHVVELGCSAGIMLIFDKYAYEMRPGEVVGPADAQIRLKGELHGDARLEMPRVLTRTGIDLNLIDPHSAEDRRWMLATCFPELRGEQQRLGQAMDMVAGTDIRWLEGDALAHVPRVLAETPDPLCVYHSACLFYWSAEMKAQLEAQLIEASHGRTILRVAVEPGEKFDKWQTGIIQPGGNLGEAARATGEVVVTRYADGNAEGRIVANSTSDYATVYWLD